MRGFLFFNRHDQIVIAKLIASISDPLNKKWRTRDVLKNTKFYTYLPLSITPSFISTGLMFHQIFIFNQKGWSMEMLGNGYLLVGFFF